MVTFSQKRITPKEAARLLESNTGNRKVRDGYVRRLAQDMANGDWNVNGETIKLTAKGELVDGQHRLLACVLANTPFTTAIANGVPNTSLETIDTGTPRKLADTLTWRGHKDTTSLAAVVKLDWRWENGVLLDRSITPTNNQCLRHLDENEGLIDALRIAKRVSTAPLRLRTSVYAPLINRVRDAAPEDLEIFNDKIATGLNLSEKDPVYALRRWLIRMHETPGSASVEVHLAVLIKAWNAAIQGADVGQLRFRRGGSSPEDFPTLLLPSDIS